MFCQHSVAIAVAISHTGNDGVSALAAMASFVTFIATLGVSSVLLLYVDPKSLKPIIGISSLDTGVLGGLIIGCVAVHMFKRFSPYIPQQELLEGLTYLRCLAYQ